MNILFITLLMFSSLMVMTSNLWMNMWLFLEINLLSFIYLLVNMKKLNSLESSLNYFLIQTIASIMLLFSMIFSLIYKNLMLMLMISLMIKMGSAPFHFWLIMLIEKLNWMMIFLLLTWQKIAPLFILMHYNNYNNKLKFIIMISLMIGSMIGMNYYSLKKIMSFSSINQLSWLMISLLIMNKMLKIYFYFYMFMMYMTIMSFYKINLKYTYQISNLKMNKFKNMFIYLNLLSLGGLPPLIGFYPKFLIMMSLNNSIMMILMILLSLMSLFYYLRLMILTMLIKSMKINLMIKKLNINYLMKMSLLSNLMMMLMFLLY